jgi:hypothetical protein
MNAPMKTIMRFRTYLESISGTEMIGSMGPNYGTPVLRPGVDMGDVTLMHCSVDGKMYTKEEYDELYKQYIARGGKPLDGVNKSNLDLIVGDRG